MVLLLLGGCGKGGNSDKSATARSGGGAVVSGVFCRTVGTEQVWGREIVKKTKTNGNNCVK